MSCRNLPSIEQQNPRVLGSAPTPATHGQPLSNQPPRARRLTWKMHIYMDFFFFSFSSCALQTHVVPAPVAWRCRSVRESGWAGSSWAWGTARSPRTRWGIPRKSNCLSSGPTWGFLGFFGAHCTLNQFKCKGRKVDLSLWWPQEQCS